MKEIFKILRRKSSFALFFDVNRWRYLFYKLPKPEKLRLALISFSIAIVFLLLAGYDYFIIREPLPAPGGDYTEGIIGFPRFLNPTLGVASDAERDVIELVFAGLTKHNEKGQIVGDLAESHEISPNGRVYTFKLRENLAWPDGTPLTSADVLFTINIIQNPDYSSPLRSAWQGVRAEAVDEHTVRFTLNLPYRPFLENTTVGILPKHFWQEIGANSFALAELNTKPIGAGPYLVKKISKNSNGLIRSIELQRNDFYHNSAWIEKIVLRFYPNEEVLLAAWQGGEIDAMGLPSPHAEKRITSRGAHRFSLSMPRYFAVFFQNGKNPVLDDFNVRQALARGTNRDRIINEVLAGNAIKQEGPLPSWLLPEDHKATKYIFNIELARQTLEQSGWRDANNDGVLEKQGQVLEFTLTTVDLPELTQVASILAEDWNSLGAKVNLDIVPANSIQSQTIRTREFEALLFGEVLGLDPDPFSFWHSTQRTDPGLNLSYYRNERVDSILQRARQTLDLDSALVSYEEFNQILTNDLPAIFLYNPYYVYFLPNKIKGFNTEKIGIPSGRFENIEGWYIKTKRVIPS